MLASSIVALAMLLTQSPENAALMQRAIKNLKGRMPLVTAPSDSKLATPELAATVCSVPLLEMKPPKDIKFPMQILKPKAFSNMPMAKAPAPPCEKDEKK